MKRHLTFLGLLALAVAACAPVWMDWALLALQDKRYANAPLIVAISAGLIYLRKREVFRSPAWWPRLGAPLVGAALALYAAAGFGALSLPQPETLALRTSAALAACVAVFVLVYGRQPVAAARFPLLLLLLVIPIPPSLLDTAVVALQNGSAETAHALFQLSGEAVYRDAYTFSLPGVSIEIASECSGIRSTHALFIAGILAGHVFLSSGWRKLCLVAATVPIGILANALRIVTMSLLAVNGSPRLLYGDVHDYTGRLFSLLSLALLGGVLFLLRRSEGSHRQRPQIATNSTLAAQPLETQH